MTDFLPPGAEACSIPGPIQLSDDEARLFQAPGHVDRVLREVRRIAVVGLSRHPERPSHYVPAYLQQAGYDIVPVTPQAGPILGVPTVSTLSALSEPVDLALVFRPGPACVGVARDAIAAGIPRIWFQFHIPALEAARLAAASGLEVVLDRCMMVEHRRWAK